MEVITVEIAKPPCYQSLIMASSTTQHAADPSKSTPLNGAYFEHLKYCEQNFSLYRVKGSNNTMFYMSRRKETNQMEPILAVTFFTGDKYHPNYLHPTLATKTPIKNVLQWILPQHREVVHIVVTNLTTEGCVSAEIFIEADGVIPLNNIKKIKPGQSLVVDHKNVNGIKRSLIVKSEKSVVEDLVKRKLTWEEEKLLQMGPSSDPRLRIPAVMFSMNIKPSREIDRIYGYIHRGAYWMSMSSFLRKEPQAYPRTPVKYESDGPERKAYHASLYYGEMNKLTEKMETNPEFIESKSLNDVKILATIITGQSIKFCKYQPMPPQAMLLNRIGLISPTFRCLLDPTKIPNTIIVPCGCICLYSSGDNKALMKLISNQCPLCLEHIIAMFPRRFFHWG